MGLPKNCRRFTVVSFLFALCLPFALAQDNPPDPQIPGRNNAGLRQPPGRVPIQPPQSEIGAAEIFRLLDLPAAQRALGVADEQRKKLEDIAFNFRRAMVQQEAALRVQQLDLERLIRADTPDRAAIDKKIQEIAQAQSSVMRTRVNGLLDVRSNLTREQRDRIREFMQQRNQQRLQPGMAPAPRLQSGVAPAVPPQIPPSPPRPPVPPQPPQ
jgi:Spy/CpxP family protein refolding chaperone